VLTLDRVPLDRVDWPRLDASPDRVLFQTRPWLEFLERTQGAEPVVAELSDGGGWFTGAIVKKAGVRILGSPFPGWTTAFMGFNLADGVSRREAVQALTRFAFKELGCLHLELRDRNLALDDVAGLGFGSSDAMTFLLDVSAEEDELFQRWDSSARRAFRKSEKSGVTVEEASGVDFADEYYTQLLDVFAKQELTPGYGVERVRELIRSLEPTGNVMLLRARDAEGTSIATAVFPGFNGVAYFWGGASYREHQILRPNEAVFWNAMRMWKARGGHTLDLAGGGDYKKKYGPTELHVPFLRKARFPGIATARVWAEKVLARGHR
jgi:hypothetical protein